MKRERKLTGMDGIFDQIFNKAGTAKVVNIFRPRKCALLYLGTP